MVLENQGNVSVYGSPRQEGEILKYVGERIQAAFRGAANLQHPAGIGTLQTADEPQQSRLSAAGRAEDAYDPGLRDFEVDVAHDLELPRGMTDTFKPNVHGDTGAEGLAIPAQPGDPCPAR